MVTVLRWIHPQTGCFHGMMPGGGRRTVYPYLGGVQGLLCSQGLLMGTGEGRAKQS